MQTMNYIIKQKKRKTTTKINTEINNFVQLYKNKNKGSKINT